jgi:hypothetical protein
MKPLQQSTCAQNLSRSGPGLAAGLFYRWIDLKIIPSYKFQGVLLIDVDEVDLIIKGLRRHEIKALPKSKRQQKTESPAVAK